jgi:hypothetical protein
MQELNITEKHIKANLYLYLQHATVVFVTNLILYSTMNMLVLSIVRNAVGKWMGQLTRDLLMRSEKKYFTGTSEKSV